MKILKRILLINWHRFVYEVIDVNGIVLVIGENGSGKSTLLDGIMYVVTAGTSKFNTAASEKNKRDLKGYVRCRTSKKDKTYERSGYVSSHVVLEFFDTENNSSLLMGAVFDSKNEIDSPDEVFYYINDATIEDLDYFSDGNVLDASEVVRFVEKSAGSDWSNRKNEAGTMFRYILGVNDSRYSSTLAKALACKDIDSVRKFIYSFLLEQKELNVDHLKRNVRELKELNTLISRTKAKISQLVKIVDQGEEIENFREELDKSLILKTMAMKDVKENELKKHQQQQQDILIEIESLKKGIEALEEEVRILQARMDVLNSELDNNEDKKAYDKLKKMLKDCNEQLQRHRLILSHYSKLKENEHSILKFLIENSNQKDTNDFKHFYNAISNSDEPITHKEFALLASRVTSKYNELDGKIRESIAKKNIELNEVRTEIKRCLDKLKLIDSKKVDYPWSTRRLIELIKHELKRKYGKEVGINAVCELIEIKNDRWRDAVEGYLNTQKFDVIVPSEFYEDAKFIYEAMKDKERIHSVGIVNVKALSEQVIVNQGSLAEEVECKSSDVRKYINLLLNKVMKAENLTELEKHNVSITDSCMIYRNFTTRNMNPKRYEIPYIGQKAFIVQKELYEKKKLDLTNLARSISSRIEVENTSIDLIKNNKIESLVEAHESFDKVKDLSSNVEALTEAKEEVDKTSFMEQQLAIEKLENNIQLKHRKIQSKKKEVEIKLTNKGKMEETASIKANGIQELKITLDEHSKKNDGMFNLVKQVYSEDVISNSLYSILNREKTNEIKIGRRLESTEETLERLQKQFITDYDFDSEYGSDHLKRFIEELYRLEKTDIVNYEDDFKQLQIETDEVFRSDFLSKLYEYIDVANDTFKRLNKILGKITFGKSIYQYRMDKREEYAHFYKMIQAYSNIDGAPLLMGDFEEEHKRAMDDLYAKLLSEDNESDEEFKELSDYRTYLDFDIERIEGDETFLLSQAIDYNSGGEHQVPYYVTIAASINQLYQNSMRTSAGLVLLDEAFNNMDATRTASMMQFMNELDIQPIIVVPTANAQTIIDYVDTVIEVSNEEDGIFVDINIRNDRKIGAPYELAVENNEYSS